MKDKIFTKSETAVIEAMYQLDRWATIYEISDWTDLSWNTVNTALRSLRRRKIVKSKAINGKMNWIIIE